MDDRKLQEIIKAVGNAKVRRYIVHDGVEYGIYLEFGTNRMVARPSLRPAYERVTRDLPEAIGQAVELAINPDDILAKAARDIQALWSTDVPVDTGAYKNSITTSVE